MYVVSRSGTIRPDNGHYSEEDRARIKDMALRAVRVAMGNDQWNWRFGLGLEELPAK